MVAIKPVILFVHGAWQTASQWQPLAQGLTSIGYNVSQPQSPSSGTDIAALRGKTYRDDVSVIHSAMEPYLEAGREIVIVSHSYGGIPASAAVEGNQVHERRARGLSGGIKHIVYLAAFALPAKNTSLLTTIGGKFGPYMNNMGDVIALGEGAKDALYNDTDPELADELLAAGFLQSTASFETPQTFSAGDIAVPKTYVIAEDDHALPPARQEAMISALSDVTVVRVPAGHCVHLNPKVIPTLVETIEAASQASC